MIDLAPERAIVVRPARPDDQAFVTATMSEQLARAGSKDANAIVDRVASSDAVRVLVAIDPDRPPGRDCVGWLVFAPIPRVRAVLFVYVRRGNRNRGIAQTLVNAAWPKRSGQWVHAGLVGGSTRSLLQRFNAVEMPLSDLL